MGPLGRPHTAYYLDYLIFIILIYLASIQKGGGQRLRQCELVVFFHHVDPRVQTQVVKLGEKHFCLLSSLADTIGLTVRVSSE